MSADPATACIALGSNLGDREASVLRAIERIGSLDGTSVTGRSALYETAPVGPPGQGQYINACITIETALQPPSLMSRLLEIERTLGRTRSGERWGPRAIDLDILLYDDRVIDEPGLRVPHPRMHERAFVLVPLAEAAPGATHPVLGLTAVQMLARLARSMDAETMEADT